MVQLNGTSGADTIVGTIFDDILDGLGGRDDIYGWSGDDLIRAGRLGGTVRGGDGDDTLYGYGAGDTDPAQNQTRMSGGFGEDSLIMDTSRAAGDTHDLRFGHHAFGGSGRDDFVFTGIGSSDQRVVGRLGDFDPTRDRIWLDGERLDLHNLPDNARVVKLDGQQWLLIEERVLYALEGARHESPTVTANGRNADTNEENHFIDWPAAWADGVPQSATVNYVDPVNFVPARMVPAAQGLFNDILATLANVVGTVGQDWIIGSENRNYDIRAGGAADFVWGHHGDDTLYGGAGNDTLDGYIGNDRLIGNEGNDILDGHKGHDRIRGGSGDDAIAGGQDNDRIAGGHGKDTIFGGSEDDVLFGNSSADRLFGGSGTDKLSGQSASDLLRGNSGADLLRGNYGADTLHGGTGHDTIVGGVGADVMKGNAGADRFVFASKDDSRPGRVDHILDFGRGNDVLHLSKIDADTGRSGNQDFTFGGTDRAPHTLWYDERANGVILRGDIDGDRRADIAIFLDGVDHLTAGDFIL